MRSILRPIILIGLLWWFWWYIYTKTDLGISLQGKTIEVSTWSEQINTIWSWEWETTPIWSIDSLLAWDNSWSVIEVLSTWSIDSTWIVVTSWIDQSTWSQPIQIFATSWSENNQKLETWIQVQTWTNPQAILPTDIDQIISESEEVVWFRKWAIIKNYQAINQTWTAGSTWGNIKKPIIVPVVKPAIVKPVTQPTQTNCTTPRWTKVKHWDYTIAFKSSIANVCEFEKRYCYQWNLQGSFTNHTCRFSNSQWTYLFKWQKSQSLDELIKKSNNTSYKENYPLFWSNDSKNWTSSQQKSPSSTTPVSTWLPIWVWPIGTWKKLLDENLLAARNPNNNWTITSTNKPTQRINTVVASSSFKDSYKTDKTILQWWTCSTPWWQILWDWQSTLAFEQKSTSDWLKCNYETRYCDNWKLQWSYQYLSCDRVATQELARSCWLWNRVVPHGWVVIAAQKPFAKNWEKCIYEARYCNNWTLQWNYEYLECTS